MADNTNALAPKITGMNRLIDWAVQKLDPNWFPTAGKTFVETAQGVRSPITESHFSPGELDIMRQLIALKGGDVGDVQYKDYVALASDLRKQGVMPASLDPSIVSMSDPLGNVQTTLGRFRYIRDKDGTLRIVDSYDFNPPSASTGQEMSVGELSPYGVIRRYAGEKIPPGYGRQVNVNLGK